MGVVPSPLWAAMASAVLVLIVGYPLLIGPSRKSFIGRTLNVEAGERDDGTMACIAIGIARGADIVRVHDVESAVRIARMTDAILRAPASGDGA